MIVLGKGNGDAHLCIPQVCTEAPLPPPSSGSRCVCSSCSRQHEVFNTKGHRQRATLEAKTCCCCCCMVHYSERIIIRGADLSDFVSLIVVGKMCVFVSRPMKIVTFLWKNAHTQNGLLIFFGKETHSQTKSWKSSRILTKTVSTTTVNHGNRRGFCV